MKHFDAIIIGTGQAAVAAQNLGNLLTAEKAAWVSTSIEAQIGFKAK